MTSAPLAPSDDPLQSVGRTDREHDRDGFPHDLFTELRRHGSVFRHPRAKRPAQREGVEFWLVVGPDQNGAATPIRLPRRLAA